MKLLDESEDNISSLKVHEWLAITIVIGLIGGLACLTSFYGRREASAGNVVFSDNQYPRFEVVIKGAVDHPGSYQINSEIKLNDLLELAGVDKHADLRRFNLNTVLKKSRVINVPLRAMIKVFLKGAVTNDQTFTIPKGSKLQDLIAVTDFSDGADVNAFKKKRRLKADEVIIVPFLK